MALPLAITISFLVTATLMPVVIRLFKSVNILDKPDRRKIHSVSTPSLGGIAIFMGICISLMLAMKMADLAAEKYLIGGALMIFLLGVRDDLSSLLAHHKLVVQIFSASLAVSFGGFQIEGLNGLFGIHAFPWVFNEIFTIFIIVVLTNAFNLIDGIDGLAGGIALIISGFLGWTFIENGSAGYATFCFAIAGASLGFLIYNWYPSRVFMGDTGSMLLGFMLSTLMVKFVTTPPSQQLVTVSPIATSLALFALPVYDTLRVIVIRLLKGKPPLAPDRNHIHHVLLKLGLNHAQSTLCLIGYNMVMIFLVMAFQNAGELWLMLIMATLTIIVGALLDRKLMKREEARLAKIIPPEIKLSKSRTSV